MSATTTEEHLLHVHDRAVEAIAKMRDQVAVATEFWKYPKHDDGGYALKMPVSLANQLCSLMGTGLGRDTNVYRDDELSLYVTTASGIVYGMIFHSKDRPDDPQEGDLKLVGTDAPRMGRFCAGHENRGMRGTEPCLKPYYRGEPTCNPGSLSHPDPAIPASAPVLGEWSFHS